MGTVAEPSYEDAGVSLGKAEAVVERLRTAVESTRTAGVVGAFGAFAGLFDPGGDRLLAASTDGLGTKLVLARKAGRLREAGACLAAHCINDVLTCGAQPLFFLDYVAAAKLDLEQVAELVEGAAATCRAAGCAIIGGETAEMPGVYVDGELDVAGTCVGAVERELLIDGSRVEPGDVVLGFPSSGFHCNGYTLVRSLLGDGPFDADLFLAPTRLYVNEVARLRERCDVRALANVTGGGIPGNLARVLPGALRAAIDPASWERPDVFRWLDERGVPEDEQRRVFNLGVGYCAVVPAADAPASGLPAIGRIERGPGGVVFTDR